MISVVITLYNLETYISKCIDSILNQTYKDLEIIIVNDCSTDNSVQVVNSYHDKRIKLINNKVNVGAGMSRRIGIQNCRGEYVILVDGDDYLNNDFIEKLYIGNTEYDIITGGVNVVNDNGDILYKHTDSEWELGGYNKYQKYIGKPICFLNNNLVRRTLYDKVEYCDRRYIEDTPTLMKLLYYADKQKNIEYCGYNYLKRETSLTHTADKIKNYIYHTLFFLDMCEFFKDKPDCYLHNIYTIDGLKNQICSMSLNRLKPEDFVDYIDEWNYIVDYV